jgi:hypothetical protein
MKPPAALRAVILAAAFIAGATNPCFAQAPATAVKAAPLAKPVGKAMTPLAPELDPRAVELLREMSNRLAAAKSMSFTAVVNKYGTNYYLLGNTWFKPAYGANGVYYSVVPAP